MCLGTFHALDVFEVFEVFLDGLVGPCWTMGCHVGPLVMIYVPRSEESCPEHLAWLPPEGSRPKMVTQREEELGASVRGRTDRSTRIRA